MASILMQSADAPNWTGGFVRALGVFVIGSALGFGITAMFGPIDLATTASESGRPGLMDMWVKFGLPIMALLAIGRALASRSDRPAVTLAATTLTMIVSVALVWALYPGSRSQAVAVTASKLVDQDVVESALSGNPKDLVRHLARFDAVDRGDAFLVEYVHRNSSLLVPRAVYDEEALGLLRQLAAQGRPKDCPECAAAISARILYEDAAPGTLGSSFALCANVECRERLAQLLLAGGFARFCVDILDRREMLDGDLGPLARLARGADAELSADTRRRMAAWLERHPEGECPMPVAGRAR